MEALHCAAVTFAEISLAESVLLTWIGFNALFYLSSI